MIVSTKEGRCAIIDPGYNSPEEKSQLDTYIKSKGLKPTMIALTHGHFDHIFGVKDCIDTWGIPVYMHHADRVILDNNGWFCTQYGFRTPEVFPTTDIKEGDILDINTGSLIQAENLETGLEVIETPGHTPGGVCYLNRDSKVLIAGDSIFAGAIGRTDNEWGNYDDLMRSILTKIMVLNGDIDIIPGHGPQTDVAYEGQNNPFLVPFNEPLPDDFE